MGGSADLLDTPLAKHSVENHANWTAFVLMLINGSILLIGCLVIFIDVESIMITGSCLILISIINIYRGAKKGITRPIIIGVFGLIIVTIIILVINIYGLSPARSQELISQLGVGLTVPYCMMVIVFLLNEYKLQKKKHHKSI